MNLSLSQKFNTRSLLRFTMPSIIMMVFMSCYTIVDGIFVSRFAGSSALSSLNIVYPVISVVVAIGTMIATGGNAIISISLGQGKEKEAREYMSLFVFLGTIISILLGAITLCFLTQFCYFLGANDALLADCQTYLLISVLFAPACMLQILFQSYLVTAGRPTLGLILTIAAGIINIVLDYIFIVQFHMGIGGAALATGIGQTLPALAGLFYFVFTKEVLHFTRFSFHPKAIINACYNGSSEMVSQLSNAIVTFLFNIILIRLAGANGVAAITILLYGQFLFNAFYMGYSMGISPILGYKYGADNKSELKHLYKISMLFVIISSVLLMILSIVSARSIVTVFTKEPETFALAANGFRIFALNFLFSGINILSSGIFTALSNGKISAIISFARTLVFLVSCLLVFPQIMGINGVWIAVPVAELLTFIMCIFIHMKYFIKPGSRNYLI